MLFLPFSVFLDNERQQQQKNTHLSGTKYYDFVNNLSVIKNYYMSYRYRSSGSYKVATFGWFDVPINI